MSIRHAFATALALGHLVPQSPVTGSCLAAKGVVMHWSLKIASPVLLGFALLAVGAADAHAARPGGGHPGSSHPSGHVGIYRSGRAGAKVVGSGGRRGGPRAGSIRSSRVRVYRSARVSGQSYWPQPRVWNPRIPQGVKSTRNGRPLVGVRRLPRPGVLPSALPPKLPPAVQVPPRVGPPLLPPGGPAATILSQLPAAARGAARTLLGGGLLTLRQVRILVELIGDPSLPARLRGTLARALRAEREACRRAGSCQDGEPELDTAPQAEEENEPVEEGDAGEEEEVGGVLLTEVEEGAAADQAGLRAGDVILSFGGVPTPDFDSLKAAVSQADGPVEVVFINGETGETESLTVTPEDHRIGVSCAP
jgi:hypothetical protein